MGTVFNPGDLAEAEALIRRMGEAGPAGAGILEGLASSLAGGGGRGVAPASTTIRDAELRYRTLVEQIPAVTFMASLDGAGNELYVSPQIEAMLGFTQEEWLENPILWYERLHPDDRDLWQEGFARTCTTGEPFRSEYRFVARDGGIVWVSGEAKVVRDEGGSPCSSTGSPSTSAGTSRPRRRCSGRTRSWSGASGRGLRS